MLSALLDPVIDLALGVALLVPRGSHKAIVRGFRCGLRQLSLRGLLHDFDGLIDDRPRLLQCS